MLVKNDSYPLILGSITRNSVVSMCDIAMFNLFLDETNIKRSLGGSGDRTMRAVLHFSQGVKGQFANKISVLND